MSSIILATDLTTAAMPDAEAVIPDVAVAADQLAVPPSTESRTRTVATVLVAVVVVLFAVRLAAAFFIPLVISLVASYALAPIVNRLERWRCPRALGAALLMVVIVAGGISAIHRASSDAEQLLEQLPSAVQKIRLAMAAASRESGGPLEHVQRAAAELEKFAGTASPSNAPSAPGPAAPAIDVKSVLLMGTGSVVTATGQILSVIFLTYFLLAAGDLFRRKLVQVVGPSLTRRKIALKILNDIHALNQRYFAVVLAINAIIGIVTGIALRLIGLDHAAVWGVVAAVLHTIPYLGVALLAAIVALDAYIQFSTLQMALLAGVMPVVISFVLGVWLQAILMARAARMNAPVVFISLLFWGMLWGAWGLFLAMPIMATIKTICDHIESLNKFGNLLGQENKE